MADVFLICVGIHFSRCREPEIQEGADTKYLGIRGYDVQISAAKPYDVGYYRKEDCLFGCSLVVIYIM